MRPRFAVLVLGAGSLSLLGFGLATLLAPELLEATGLGVDNAGARTEVRAFYGGLELALGLFLALAGRRPERRAVALWLMMAVFAGIGAGRSIGLLVEGETSGVHLAALITELVLAGLAGAALWRSRREQAAVVDG